ncbi:MAG: phytanoyl-CoA dioxygenase family protein [Candidatus Poribacteria bacterium]|nr:phytanoyl-CoA dioxygenase family protein [Candidatus Poribacteria bacterium]
MKLPFLHQEIEVSTDLRDSNDILDNPGALHERMAEDGYLLIRGLHDKETVLAARRAILEKLAAKGMLAPDTPLMDGTFNPDYPEPTSTGSMGNKPLTQLPAFNAVVEGAPIMGFFKHFLGGEARTFDFKWLRTAGPGSGSPIHYDVVFMGRGTKNLYSCWTPFGDVSLDMGPIVFCLGSNRFEKVRETYGQADVDRDLIKGHFSDDPLEIVEKFGGHWATTSFSAGDVIIFSMFLMHASLVNTSDKIRITADTRYQLAAEPIDERWIGKNPKGHYAWKRKDAEIESLEESRRRWGV